MHIDNQSVKMRHNGYDFYRDPSCVPIKELAEILGMQPDKTGKFKCPCPDHADNNPSTELTERGKYQNTWKCWACGEHGDALNLVMAEKYGVSPSQYWNVLNNHNGIYSKEDVMKMHQIRVQAMQFIEQYFPGNIIYTSIEEKKPIEKPIVPKWVWQELDLPARYDKPTLITYEENKEIKSGMFEKLNDFEAGTLMTNKLIELQGKLLKEKNKVLEWCSNLNTEAKLEIDLVYQEKITIVENLEEEWFQYLNILEMQDHIKSGINEWEDIEEVEKQLEEEIKIYEEMRE